MAHGRLDNLPHFLRDDPRGCNQLRHAVAGQLPLATPQAPLEVIEEAPQWGFGLAAEGVRGRCLHFGLGRAGEKAKRGQLSLRPSRTLAPSWPETNITVSLSKKQFDWMDGFRIRYKGPQTTFQTKYHLKKYLSYKIKVLL